MIGDVVGEPGLLVLETCLPQLIKEHSIDLTVVNGENSADGYGINDTGLYRILSAGADVVSSGNHVWEKRDFWAFLDTEQRILRPANYPARVGSVNTPGKGWICLNKTVPENSRTISALVINLQGREFMNAIDCPFRCFDSIREATPGETPVVVVDFHAESTREKEALAYYLDGRASLVGGTHTHVQTADERILPGGTAYITDLGMTGITRSVIGMEPQVCLERAGRHILYRMVLAGTGESKHNAEAVVQGLIAEIDCETGKAVSVRRI